MQISEGEAMQIVMMRRMAWERAKAELRSTYATFYNQDPRFAPYRDAVERLIDEVEAQGWMDAVAF